MFAEVEKILSIFFTGPVLNKYRTVKAVVLESYLTLDAKDLFILRMSKQWDALLIAFLFMWISRRRYHSSREKGKLWDLSYKNLAGHPSEVWKEF